MMYRRLQLGHFEQLTVSMTSEASMLNGIPEAGLLWLTVQMNVRKSEKSLTFLAGAYILHRLFSQKFSVLSKIRHTGDRKRKRKVGKGMLRDAVLTVGDIFNNYNFDVNCNYDVYDCTKQGSDWQEGAPRVFSTLEDGDVIPQDDILNMVVSYMTLDSVRNTIVVEGKRE